MRKFDFFDDIVAPILSIGIPAIILYGIFKLFQGIYNLLDKLIDKL
jgi:hypothetical protein